MRIIGLIISAALLFCTNSFSQKPTYKNLIGGAWKRDNLPDSAFAVPGDTAKVLVVNFWVRFIDSSKAEVSFNGFYFKAQSFKIDTSNNLIYVDIHPNLENVANSLWIIKYINSDTIKVQQNAFYKSNLPWNDNEKWFNTDTLKFYKD